MKPTTRKQPLRPTFPQVIHTKPSLNNTVKYNEDLLEKQDGAEKSSCPQLIELKGVTGGKT